VVPKGRQGAVAVINVHFRCDAILIHNGTIETIPLPRLTMKSAREATKCLEFIQKRFPPPHIQEWLWNLVLLWLWEVAVRPVLDYLGYTAPPSKPDEWPRVWWVPTGEVSQLPFHAAGIHRRGSSSSALDRVVSSYSSSVKALLYTQSIVLDHKKRHDDGGNSAKTRVVIASMSTTPAHRSLAFVQDEVRAVKEKAGSSATINELPQPLKQQVIKGLKSCDVFHFAGHGASYIDDPDRGCLLLEDWETEPLAVKDILGLRLHKHVPFLAYLSACSTGANRTASLSDEVIHLVTAFQLAGFQHVIGSFWAVSDYASRKVAGDFYARLGGRFGRDVDVALALHLAVRQLRVAPSRPGLRSTDEVEPDAEHILACDASRADEDRAQGPEIDSFLAELGNSRSLGFSEEDWSDVRDPRPGSVRRPMAKVHAMRNPVLWAPYFHTGF
jgi:CHAT domain-containing protein